MPRVCEGPVARSRDCGPSGPAHLLAAWRALRAGWLPGQMHRRLYIYVDAGVPSTAAGSSPETFAPGRVSTMTQPSSLEHFVNTHLIRLRRGAIAAATFVAGAV